MNLVFRLTALQIYLMVFAGLCVCILCIYFCFICMLAQDMTIIPNLNETKFGRKQKYYPFCHMSTFFIEFKEGGADKRERTSLLHINAALYFFVCFSGGAVFLVSPVFSFRSKFIRRLCF